MAWSTAAATRRGRSAKRAFSRRASSPPTSRRPFLPPVFWRRPSSRPSSRPPLTWLVTWLAPWSWLSPSCAWPLLFPLSLFFAKHALWIEIANAAALTAGGRVDHCIDEGRLTGVHSLVYGALELVRRRRVDADAAESIHDLVVARAFDEDGRRNVRPSG